MENKFKSSFKKFISSIAFLCNHFFRIFIVIASLRYMEDVGTLNPFWKLIMGVFGLFYILYPIFGDID